MSQPYSPDRFSGFAADADRDASQFVPRKPLVRGLAVGLLGAIDFWLVTQLVQSIGAILTQQNSPLILALAAIGCALEAGAALMLTWLLIDEHPGSKRPVFS